MSEKPEEMLVEDRIAAVGRIEDVSAEPPIDKEEQQIGSECRKRHEDQERCGDHFPSKNGNTPHRHSRCAIDEHRGDEIDRRKDRRTETMNTPAIQRSCPLPVLTAISESGA